MMVMYFPKSKQLTWTILVEIRILSTLEHPNIIKYLGAEFTATTLRVFLDLASEGSLKDILNEFGNELLFFIMAAS